MRRVAAPTSPPEHRAFHCQAGIIGAHGRGPDRAPVSPIVKAVSRKASVSATTRVRLSARTTIPLGNSTGSDTPASEPSGAKLTIGVRGGPGGA